MLWLLLCLPGCTATPSYTDKNAVSEAPVEPLQRVETFSIYTNQTSELKEKITAPSNLLITDVVVESTQSQINLWQRIRAGYQLNLEDYPASVLKQRDWYIKHPRYIATVINRAKPFIHYVTEQLSDAGLPLELALLPIIESTYDAYAYSPSHAAGLWQFIPATAQRFDLKRDRWYDGRRDVVASTTAAIAYLSYLHQRFDNDWLLALAAYNSGEGTVGRAIKANAKLDKSADFWHLKLPKETRNYVPKLLALASVIQDSESLNITLPDIKNQAYFDIVHIDKQISLSKVIEITDADYWLFSQLNAGYRRSTTPPQGAYRLLIPTDKSASFLEFLKTNDPKNWIPHTEYVVVNGDSLSQIAARFNSHTDTIKNSNNLTSDQIRIGQLLTIPNSSSEVAASDTTGRYPLMRHEVIAGDSLSSLAIKYGSSVKELQMLNALEGGLIKIGQVLEIRSSKQASKAVSLRKISYKVKRGDSLYTIAKNFALSIADITNWNGINKKIYLQPGQQLTLYINPRNI
jgi:membrane-bound lytic murein transglycosylase D